MPTGEILAIQIILESHLPLLKDISATCIPCRSVSMRVLATAISSFILTKHTYGTILVKMWQTILIIKIP